MTTSYPNAVDTFSTKVDRGLIYHYDWNNIQDAILALERQALAGGGGFFNIETDFGAVGDDATDNRSALNAAIAAANAIHTGSSYGAVVWSPPGRFKHNGTLLTPSRNVRILGPNTMTSNGYNSASAWINIDNTTPSFNLGNGSTSGVKFEGLAILGSGGTNLLHRGIFATSLSNSAFINVMFDNFGGSGLRIDGGQDIIMDGLYVTNCLLGYASLSDFAGGVELGSIENFGYRSNINGVAGVGAHSNGGSGYMCALLCKNALNHWFTTTFAYGQTGVRVADVYALHEFDSCRFEYNQKNGLWYGGTEGRIVNCRFQDNSQGTDGADAHLRMGSSGTLAAYANLIANNMFETVSYPTHVASYGIDMQAGNSAAWSLENTLANNRGNGFKTRLINIDTSNTAPVVISPSPRTQSLTGSTSTTTFDGQQGNTWVLTCASGQATQITATNLLPGQVYDLYIIQHATPGTVTLNAIFSKTAAFTSPAASKHLSGRFRSDGTNLFQIGTFSGDM